jgi:hypothetical protein
MHFKEVAPNNAFPSFSTAVRVVFEVSLEGSARKLITVRSALTVCNKLPQPVFVRLENTALKVGGKPVNKNIRNREQLAWMLLGTISH